MGAPSLEKTVPATPASTFWAEAAAPNIAPSAKTAGMEKVKIFKLVGVPSGIRNA
jgi:hypothetical protein